MPNFILNTRFIIIKRTRCSTSTAKHCIGITRHLKTNGTNKQKQEQADDPQSYRQTQNDNNITSILNQDTFFAQAGPQHDLNSYLADPFLQRCLTRLIPKDVYDEHVRPDLSRFGQRAAPEIWDLGRQCENEPPYLAGHTDAWGHRMKDQLITSPAWKKQKEISAEEGLISIPYERKHQYSRIHQVAKLFLYAPVSGLYSCPLAMTDGAAKILGGVSNTHPDIKEAYDHLISRNPDEFWTSGQWMTEKRGGSDVGSGTETYAVGPQENGMFDLHGYKWFSSATDSDMTLTLARIANEEGEITHGTPGISMFFARTRLPNTNESNGITIFKLKNKLGTKQLPTGELVLEGTKARLISQVGRGIASISPMLTVTRLHNIISSVGAQRKMLNLARDYSRRREAFGKRLFEHPLHIHTLCKIETEIRGCTVLMLDLARQLGEEETGTISKEDALLLRLMMPVAKAYTAKKAVSNISEGLECFGGQGYIEDTGLPGILRDVQVLPIWEGTTNVMALDTVRAIGKTNGQALEALHGRILRVIEKGKQSSHEAVQNSTGTLNDNMKKFIQYMAEQDKLSIEQSIKQQTVLRDFMFTLANLYIGTLLLEHVVNTSDVNNLDVNALKNWMGQTDLIPVVTNDKRGAYELSEKVLNDIVFDGYDPDSMIESKFVR